MGIPRACLRGAQYAGMPLSARGLLAIRSLALPALSDVLMGMGWIWSSSKHCAERVLPVSMGLKKREGAPFALCVAEMILTATEWRLKVMR